MSLTQITKTVINDNTSSSFSFRNLIINGDMSIHQRGITKTSLSGSPFSGYYTSDRWFITGDTFGTWTQSAEIDAPSGTNLRKSFKMLCTSANGSLSAGSNLSIQQRMEGQLLQGLKKGTNSAENIMLSFWVKSNLIGTYIVEFFDNNNTRVISRNYTINSTNVWEKKTITIPGDTTGVLTNDSNFSFAILFWMGAGTNFNPVGGTLNTSWGTPVSATRAVGQVNLAETVNNYWQITGVQMEIGTVVTPFEQTPYDVQLMRCMRYYETSYNVGTYPGTATIDNAGHVFYAGGVNAGGIANPFRVKKRGLPNVTVYSVNGTAGQIYNAGSNVGASISNITEGAVFMYAAGSNMYWHSVANAEL